MFDAITTEPIKAGQERLARIFGDEYAFSIPVYQRPYAWELEQAGALIEDILGALGEARARREPAVTYFLGSIVLIKQPGSADAQVIDGQQRLTTLTILLAVLRDLSDDQVRWKRHKYICEEGDVDKGSKDRFRLIQRKRDADFFRDTIQQSGATNTLPSDTQHLVDSRLRMVENARFFREHLSRLSDEDRNELMAFLLQRCYLVVIAVATIEMAHRVFTVLNARGLDLTPTDILKADLLDRAHPGKETIFSEQWEKLEEELGREKFVYLFQHIRMIHQKDKQRERLETAFKTYVHAFKDPDTFMKDVLGRYGEVFLTLQSHDETKRHYGSTVADLTAHLQRLDNSDWIAAALAFLATESTNSDKAAAFMKKLERLAYHMFVTRTNVNDRLSRYAKVIGEIEAGWDEDASDSALELTPEEKRKFICALDGNIYDMTRVRLPLLLRLDAELSSGGATYQHGIITVEHVLPQNPAEGSVWLRDFSDENVRYDWTHKIGNLLLLTRPKNAQASNWDFDRKKQEYFSTRSGISPFVITTKVLKQTEWTPLVLEEQQKTALATFAAIWDLPLSNAA